MKFIFAWMSFKQKYLLLQDKWSFNFEKFDDFGLELKLSVLFRFC